MVREVPLSRARRREAGVTLLEILVAVAVLAVGLATIFQIFPMGFAASSKSASQTIAYELAAQKMEDARNNFLFGGIPNGTAAQKYLYYGSTVAPNPDLTTYKEVNTNGAYQEFSTTSVPEKNYYYKIECDPVIDPARKYQEFPFQQGGDNTRGFATMYRITVTVRGPVQTKAEAQDPVFGAGLARKGSVQVKLATYVANKTMPEAKLAQDITVRRKTGSTYDMMPGVERNIIFVTGAGSTDPYPYPENFTVLNRFYLTPNEILDTGPTIVDPSNSLPQNNFENLNVLGLDNIVLVRPKPAGSTTNFVAESNKVIAIYGPDDPGRSTNFPTTNSPNVWQLTLLKDLYGRDNDFPTRSTATTSGGYGSTKLADLTYDGDSVLTTNGVNETYGYPAGTQVRGLMHLERRP